MRPFRILAVVLLLACSLSAQTPKLKAFIALNSVYAVSAALDGHSTMRALNSGCCREMNPLFGSYPSNARLWGQGAAMTAGVIGLDYLLMKRTKWAWIIPPVVGIGLHLTLAKHNYGLR